MQIDKRSQDNMKGLHPSLVKLITEAFKTAKVRFQVIEGVRTATRQADLYKDKKSKCDGVKIKSNHQVKSDGYGYAFDAIPIPVDWKSAKGFTLIANHFKDTAKKLGIKIEWGGDWKSFLDMPHYELKK